VVKKREDRKEQIHRRKDKGGGRVEEHEKGSRCVEADISTRKGVRGNGTRTTLVRKNEGDISWNWKVKRWKEDREIRMRRLEVQWKRS